MSPFVVGVYDKAGRLTARLRTQPFIQLSDAAGRGDRVALQRYGNPPATGVLVLGSNLKPLRFLPVTAADELETGVIGWRDDDTILFVVHRVDPSAEDGRTSHVLAWNIDSGRVTRVADFSTFETYSVAADHLPTR